MTKPKSEMSLLQLVPNMVTITAICAGLTAIRFGVQGNYAFAAQLIVLACVLDGIDGWLARRLSADSSMGAELDSLADFLNFGVAPGLILYFWALQDMRSIGWIAVLLYAVCCVVRLARFNVSAKSDENDGSYFVGVPAPAGALLVLLPMFFSFGFPDGPGLPGIVLCIYIALVGTLMISRIPTRSFKSIKISRENAKFVLVGFACAGAAVFTYGWVPIIVLTLGYVGIVVWGLIKRN